MSLAFASDYSWHQILKPEYYVNVTQYVVVLIPPNLLESAYL